MGKYEINNDVLDTVFTQNFTENGVKQCQGKDVFERMNYLYQASHFMASKDRVIASYYGSTMVGCAKKAVLRMEPNVKRTICKRCQSPLIPGETARVRLASKPVKVVKWTCLTCMNVKKYPTKKGYKLWADQPESVVQTFDYTPASKKIKPTKEPLCKGGNIKEMHNKTEKGGMKLETEMNISVDCNDQKPIKRT